MTANTTLSVTELSYDRIRDNLKTYLRSQTELLDYDFEGSVMSVLLDLHAYVTHYMAYYQNVAHNEAHLDTAQLRPQIVSRARVLGYTPRSAKSARAVIQAVITPGDSPDSITVEKARRFETTIDGSTYTFTTEDATVIFPNESGVYTANLTLVEGIVTTERTIISSANGSPIRISMLNKNVDTDSITVDVYDTPSSTAKTVFTRATDVTDVTDESDIFWLQEGLDGRWELEFGDGVLGTPLAVNNRVDITYRVTNGSACNGATSFRRLQSLGGYTTVSFQTVEAATGGQDLEDKESVRFYAPKAFERQNRCITIGDYKSYILQNHSDIQAISVWGGDEDPNPQYGRVFICAKPFNGFALTQERKQSIFNDLEEVNAISIEPVFKDAVFLYIVPTIRATYNASRTNLRADQVHELIGDAVNEFEDAFLGTFGQTFRHYEFVNKLAKAHSSITNVEVDVQLQKRFSPTLNSLLSYTIYFDHALENIGRATLSSTGFTLPAYNYTFYMEDDMNGAVKAYYLTGSTKNYLTTNLGTINYTSGVVTLNNFSPSSIVGDELQITARPSGKSFKTFRNQIMLISDTTLTVIDEEQTLSTYTDSVVTEGTAATIGTTGNVI
jgi:hypothetical protein